MASRLPKTPTSKASSSFGSTESLTTSDTASSVDVGSKAILAKTAIPKPSLSLKLSSDSVDDFSVNEKVWVNGSRPGIIRFIGETKFAVGKWIGVQLTSPDGKNDGTVAGVRYFACPNNCGVFVKPQRLTKAPMPESVFQKRLASPARTEKDLPGMLANLSTDSDSASDIGSHVSTGGLLKNSPFLSGTNGQSAGQPGAGTNGRIGSFKIGDRVLVNASSGTKLGTLMFLGETDFAAGQWAGIELDDPVGKNDGSVAGKRYFDCKAKYGLFAPLHKISAAPSSALSKPKKPSGGLSSKTSSRTSISKLGGGRLSRADSQSSVSSVASSVASSATGSRASRIRLGITSLKSPVTSGSASLGPIVGSSPSASTKKTIEGTNAAILDALKEKDEHINQLLRERDLERGEFSRVAMQADELEERVAALSAENARIATEADEEICELKRLNTEYEEVQLKLSAQLEEEKLKIEDLTFRFEEETLAKAELETFVGDLKKQVDELKTKLISGSSSSVEMESNAAKTIAEQKASLRAAEERLEEKENEIFALQDEMTRKDEAIFQMEASTEKRKAEFNGLQSRLCEIEHELEISNQRSQRYMETIDELNKKLSKCESENSQLRSEQTNLNAEIKEYEKKQTMWEERLHVDVKRARESSNQELGVQIAQLEAELERKARAEKMLEEKLAEATEKRETSEVQINTLADQLRDQRRINEEEIRRRKNAEDKIAMLTANNNSLTAKYEEVVQMSGDHKDLLKKRDDELAQKQNEFTRKEKRLEMEIDALLRDKENKDVEIRNLRVDLDNQKSIISRFEKKERDIEKLIQANENELKLTRSDAAEKQRLVEELRAQLKELNQQIISINQAQESSKGEFESQLSKLTRDYNESKKEILTLNEELRKYKDKTFELEAERDRFAREAERHQKAAEEREKTIEKVATEVADVREQYADYKKRIEVELESTKQTVGAMDDLSLELERTRGQTRQMESENGALREENRTLAAKVEELQEDIEGLKRRHTEVLNEFEFECKRTESRADAAEKLAINRMEEMQLLEHKQNIALEEYRSMAETEKKIMEQKLDELEDKIREQARQLQQEQQRRMAEDLGSYEQQVEFLNSVIVDMQKKNDELRNRVQVLEEIGLGEFEHSFQSQVETTRRGTATTASAGTMTNGHIRNIRKYCDICEIFDSHDTEDCPQQSSGPLSNGGQEPGHTYNAVRRDEVRQYCTNCERFGHEAEACPENEY